MFFLFPNSVTAGELKKKKYLKTSVIGTFSRGDSVGDCAVFRKKLYISML